MSRLRLLIPIISLLPLTFAAPASSAGSPIDTGTIKPGELREWLTFLASDELDGRDTYSEGLGIAAQYIAERLKSWGVKPGGDNGSYFQKVAIRGVKVTDNSTITVEANGETKTFKNGDGISISRPVGGKRSFTLDQVEFLGYGVSLPSAGHDDYAGKEMKGKAAVWIGSRGPEKLGAASFRMMGNRARTAVEEKGAAAGIGPGSGFRRQPTAATAPPPAGGAAASTPQRGGFGQQLEQPDFTTAERLESPRPPSVSAQEEFLAFLFSGQETKYAELKAKADAREELPRFTLKNVKITFNLDSEYRIVRTQYTRNVVGIIDGRNSALKSEYVAFGAHYDHVGYAEGEVVNDRRQGSKGRVTSGAVQDRIWNGADDDGSGTVALLGIAKAFAKGPKPKRSLMFVWHAGEERGLWGSRNFADFTTVPIEKIITMLNTDMIGRNRDNKKEEADTVYVVGSDRISTQLHNLTVAANGDLRSPMTLNFEFNDPVDPEQIYYRSDHYSYAAKGIPVAFFTTGLHPDYHANTDHPDRIEYDKMARISHLMYEIGKRVANLDQAPKRDNKGARANKTVTGALPD